MSKSKDKKARAEQDSSLIIETSESYKKLEEMALKSHHHMDTFRDSVMRNSGLPFEPIFITDGNVIWNTPIWNTPPLHQGRKANVTVTVS